MSFNNMYAASFLELVAHPLRNKIHSNSLLLRTFNREPFGPASVRMTCVKEATLFHKRGMSTWRLGLDDRARRPTAFRKDASCSADKPARHSSNVFASFVG